MVHLGWASSTWWMTTLCRQVTGECLGLSCVAGTAVGNRHLWMTQLRETPRRKAAAAPEESEERWVSRTSSLLDDIFVGFSTQQNQLFGFWCLLEMRSFCVRFAIYMRAISGHCPSSCHQATRDGHGWHCLVPLGRGSEKLSKLSKVAELVTGRAGPWTQFCPVPKLVMWLEVNHSFWWI